MRDAAVTPKYKRIMLKLSGEALMGDDAYGINRQTIEAIVAEIATVVRMGVEIGAVIGGGNIFRGVAPGAAGMRAESLRDAGCGCAWSQTQPPMNPTMSSHDGCSRSTRRMVDWQSRYRS